MGKKLFVAHNSCLNASYDINVVKEGLRKAKYNLTETAQEADEIIFAGCGAHQTWVDDVINQINKAISDQPDKKVVITGCVGEIDAGKILESFKGNHLVFQKLDDLIKTYTGLSFDALDYGYLQNSTMDFEGNITNNIRNRVGIEKFRVVAELEKIDRKFQTDLAKYYKKVTRGFVFYHEDEPVEYVTVSRSCLYKCSFCAIPKGRGSYTSVPIDIILDKIKRGLNKGIKKFTLIGDEVGNYGMDIKGQKIDSIIERILCLDKELRLNIRYIEPTPFLKHYDVFERFCLEGRIELLYVPLQSGSQRVLKMMNRNYELSRIVEKYKQLLEMSETVFFCNWMVGFPGENEEDFQQTVELAKYLNVQINSVIPFSERPNTPAATMPDKIPSVVKKERLNFLRDVLSDIKVNEFRNRLAFIDDNHEKEDILRYIKEAEAVHVDDFASESTPPRPVQIPIVSKPSKNVVHQED